MHRWRDGRRWRELWQLLKVWWREEPSRLLFVPKGALYARARQLVKEQDGIVDRSGEAKRHQVFAQLLKEFPNQPKRRIALVIEAALP